MIGTAVDHMPVLLTEVLDLLRVRKEGVYVDCTQGSGGHSEEVLSQLAGTGQLIALDRDGEALERGRERLGSHFNLQAFHQNFKRNAVVGWRHYCNCKTEAANPALNPRPVTAQF